MAKAKTTEKMDKAVELAQDGAKATLDAGVKSAEVAEDFTQDVYKAGYDANVEALKVAKNYWDTPTKIRQDWLKLFAQTSENLIDATAKMELPLQKEMSEMAKGVINNIEKTVEEAADRAKAAAK